MHFNLTAKVFMTAVSVSGTLVLTSSFGLSQTQPTPNPLITTFHCITLGTGYATVAHRGERITGPMITWNSTAFGPEFTPQRRCELVSQRLTEAVAANGGKLSKLRLVNGIIGAYPVICYINNPNEACNSNNLLLTLNQSDRGQERQILQQLVNFSTSGTTPPLTRGGRTVIYLGLEVENALGLKSAVASPTPTTSVPQQGQPVSPVPQRENSL